MKRIRPYRLVARFYDQLHGEDAARMTRQARRKLLGRILPRVRSACDLGCGTGTTAVEFARQGIKTYAVDLSPTMCRLARKKAHRAGVPVKVFCADLRRFRLPEPVDLVTCEFNPLNHLPRKSDLPRAFRAVARALQPGGLFYFDLNTPKALQKQYPGTHWFEGRDFCLVMRGSFDRRREKGCVKLEWFVRKKKVWQRFRESMEDICWTDAEVRRALRQAGFTNIRSWDGADVRPPAFVAGRGYDAYYLARKKRNPS